MEAGRDALLIYYKVSAAIKKALQSHKLGENGFKPTSSGSYFNAHENHNETFKLIEDAINQSGANVSNHVCKWYSHNNKFYQSAFKLTQINFTIKIRVNMILMVQKICLITECLLNGTKK